MDTPGTYEASFIDSDWWDAGNWMGAALWPDPTNARPPQLGILMAFERPLGKIFDDWHRRLGAVDRHEQLRISVIEGPFRGRAGYWMTIGTDVQNVLAAAREAGQVINPTVVEAIFRVKRMDPQPGSTNLALFHQAYQKHRAYDVIPVLYSPASGAMPDPSRAIRKTQIHFRRASDVGPNDVDACIRLKP